VRVPIRAVHRHNLGNDPGIDGNGERNSSPTASGLEKGGWREVEQSDKGGRINEVLGSEQVEADRLIHPFLR